MIKNDPAYNRFHLVREMYEAVDYLNKSGSGIPEEIIGSIPKDSPLILTGEGSSRIFPAKNAVHNRLLSGKGPLLLSESSTDLSDKKLDNFTVIGASNSGRTRELINLFRRLKHEGHGQLYGLTCNHETLLEKYSHKTAILETGPEKAVAATKSVIGQAVFYDTLLAELSGISPPDWKSLAKAFLHTLNSRIDEHIPEMIGRAGTVYFTGNNNGAAEELTLKANEIIRKKSAFLPGTYLLHGVEEVISGDDIIIMIDAYPDEYEKIKGIYTNSTGTTVITISTETSPFSSVIIPQVSASFEPYIKLAAGWNLLVETGIYLGIDIDKPQRARKIGNEASD